MLKIKVQGSESYDPTKREFIYGKEQTLILEHSLISLSKWESKYCKPFIGKEEKTPEETLDYIRCMSLNIDPESDVFDRLTINNIKEISNYIHRPMTATWINERDHRGHSYEAVTSELVYYWMIALNIPIECEKWHLNRLLTLVRVCNAKNGKPQKMSQQEVMARNAELNAKRRAQFHSKG